MQGADHRPEGGGGSGHAPGYLLGLGFFQGFNALVQFADRFDQWSHQFVVVDLHQTILGACQLWIHLGHFLGDNPDVLAPAIFPFEGDALNLQ